MADPKRESDAKNLLGEPLEPCGTTPMTGFYRDGCCETGPEDRGSHTVCAEMDAAFLEFTAARGNDLSTPQPGYGFVGLKPGDRWCLCSSRWLEAHEAGVAPRVFVRCTNEAAARDVPREALMGKGIDVS